MNYKTSALLEKIEKKKIFSLLRTKKNKFFGLQEGPEKMSVHMNKGCQLIKFWTKSGKGGNYVCTTDYTIFIQ